MFLLWELSLNIKQVEVVFPTEETIVRSIITYSKLKPSLSLHLSDESQSWYITNQSGSAKETFSLKIGEKIEMLVCFICVGTQDRILIDINHHYQNMMNQHKSWTWKLNINIYKVKFLQYQLLIFLNLFVIYLFRQKDCEKKVSTRGGSWLFFVSTVRLTGNKQLFQVDLRKEEIRPNIWLEIP